MFEHASATFCLFQDDLDGLNALYPPACATGVRELRCVEFSPNSGWKRLLILLVAPLVAAVAADLVDDMPDSPTFDISQFGSAPVTQLAPVTRLVKMLLVDIAVRIGEQAVKHTIVVWLVEKRLRLRTTRARCRRFSGAPPYPASLDLVDQFSERALSPLANELLQLLELEQRGAVGLKGSPSKADIVTDFGGGSKTS
ncbi:hypothetical protein T492DRAFT_913857 [Pavlovales sp. CCMP2436]|nr:hypothetical protein T492DRAFT_913857 [Pavlovales sp. CCMP2436]